ncbi:MAG: hypothetical protein V1929_06585 [bacterium]
MDGQEIYAGTGPLIPNSVARTAAREAQARTVSATALVTPVSVLTSDDRETGTNGWAAVDGNTDTAWTGQAGKAGWWIALTYDEAPNIGSVRLDADRCSMSNALYLYSLDAEHWYGLIPALSNGAVSSDYLWLIFPADTSGAVPEVKDFTVQPAK